MRSLLVLTILVLAALGPVRAQAVRGTASAGANAGMQQRIVGTWSMSQSQFFKQTITITTNGDYVALQTTAPFQTNRLEGTMTVNGVYLVDTIKKSSRTNEPVPQSFTNKLVRVNSRELLFQTPGHGQLVAFIRVAP